MIRNSFLKIIVALSLNLPSMAQTLPNTGGFLRTLIESYPELERRPIILYLDAARASADRALALLASGHSDEVFQEIVESAKAQGEVLDTKPGVAFLQNTHGTPTQFQYRTQALEFRDFSADVHDLRKATSVVFYLAKTTKYPDGGGVLAIRTIKIGANHKVLSINYVDH